MKEIADIHPAPDPLSREIEALVPFDCSIDRIIYLAPGYL